MAEEFTPPVEENTPPVEENVPPVEENTPPAEETPVVLPSDETPFTMPEKFEGKSAEDIAKAYMELEKMQSKPAEENPTETPTVTTDVLNEYIGKAAENGGELSEEHYAELEAKGFDRTMVDTYAAGVRANQQAEAVATLEKAGTDPDGYTRAVEWARENWPEDRIARFNTALEGATGDTLVSHIEGLMDAYNGRTPESRDPLHNGPSVTPQRAGYQTPSDMHKDMADPRYTTDRQFYEAVRKKVEATTAF